MARFGARRGLGIDLSESKVAEARARGFEAVEGDVRHLGARGAVRFVSMMDALEHLPSLEAAEDTIARAARAARDFLFIFHPSFEGEGAVEQHGLRQYWWHWTGHPTHLRVDDFRQMFGRLGFSDHLIRFVQPIHDSSHPTLIPLGLPKNQGPYDEREHPDKPFVRFSPPLWRAQEIFVPLRSFRRSEWRAITAEFPRRRGSLLRRTLARVGGAELSRP
jgi:hypothetical protein